MTDGETVGGGGVLFEAVDWLLLLLLLDLDSIIFMFLSKNNDDLTNYSEQTVGFDDLRADTPTLHSIRVSSV